jgi:hypothetical protein
VPVKTILQCRNIAVLIPRLIKLLSVTNSMQIGVEVEKESACRSEILADYLKKYNLPNKASTNLLYLNKGG